MDDPKLPHADMIDKESGELIEIAESHLETGMKLLARAVTPFEDRQ
jgi:hypothetical protein